MDVAEAIRFKRAVRAFAPEPLSTEDIQVILKAGRRAQSSKNTQPWQFIAIQDRLTLEALAGLGTYAGHLAGAALGVVIATADPAPPVSAVSPPRRTETGASPRWTETGAPRRTRAPGPNGPSANAGANGVHRGGERWSTQFDAGQAAAYMQLAAWERGIGSCLATLYQEDPARNLLGVPPSFRLHVALSFGRPLEPAVMTAPPRSGGRRALSVLVHWERW